jgi:hypothetical protein
MEFKKLELKPQGSWFKRTIKSEQTKKTLLYIAIGASAGAMFFYLTEGYKTNCLTVADFAQSTFMGAFLGFFITNSPCARGRC